jgi:hypothetical protein
MMLKTSSPAAHPFYDCTQEHQTTKNPPATPKQWEMLSPPPTECHNWNQIPNMDPPPLTGPPTALPPAKNTPQPHPSNLPNSPITIGTMNPNQTGNTIINCYHCHPNNRTTLSTSMSVNTSPNQRPTMTGTKNGKRKRNPQMRTNVLSKTPSKEIKQQKGNHKNTNPERERTTIRERHETQIHHPPNENKRMGCCLPP